MLATASADKFVKVWEVPSAKFVKSFEGHTHHVLDVAWRAYRADPRPVLPHTAANTADAPRGMHQGPGERLSFL